MKKTVSINISGIIFHIEEDGYEKLRNYLTSIQRYFSSYEDNKEIVADIESRIAELFIANLANNKQVITLEDVERLITKMGNVADFEAIAEDEDLYKEAKSTTYAKEEAFSGSETGYGTGYAATSTQAKRKLYRDERRKLLGGVAAGIAHYFSIDALFVRLIILVGFFGFMFIPPVSGFALVAYIILWVVLPASNELEEDRQVKKLYRDPDKRVLGGVAAGVASYFGTDESSIRLLFVLGILLGGTGIIVYFVLWAITPEANTLTEKMEMQGEPVTLSNIEHNIKKNLNFSDNEAETTLVKILLFPFRLIAIIFNGLGRVLGPIMTVLLEIIRIGAGIMLFFISLSMIVTLLIAISVAFGWLTDGGNLVHFGNLPIDMIRSSFPTIGIVFAFISTFIPTVFVGLIGITMIAKRKIITAPVGWTLFSIWVLGLIGLGITVPIVISNFSSKGYVEKVQRFDVGNKIPVLKLREAGEEVYEDTDISLEGYDGPQLELTQRFEAAGKNRAEATTNASAMTYSVTQADSVITFDSNFGFKPGTLLRGQELDMILYIPYEKPFVLSESMAHFIRNQVEWHQTNGNTWKFTKERGLVCLTCKEHPDDDRDDDDDNERYSYHDDADFGGRGEFTKELQVRDFDQINMGSAFVIHIKKGDTYKVVVSGDKDDIEDLEVDNNSRTLEIGFDGNFSIDRHEAVYIDITMPDLRVVQLSGASHTRIEGFDGHKPMDVVASGAARVDIDAQVSDMNVDISGASQIQLKGQAEKLHGELSGASVLNAFEAKTQTVDIEASGASTARVNAIRSIKADASGASSIHYTGDPSSVIKEASGGGSVDKE